MRKREIQPFTLKLNDLAEYETMRMENRSANQSLVTYPEIYPVEGNGGADGRIGPDAGSGQSHPPLVNYGPKSKQEIQNRLGME